MKVANATDQCSAGDEVIAIAQQLRHQRNVGAVAVYERVLRIVVVALRDLAVLRIVVDPNNVMAALQQLLNDITANEPG
jgi:hypothetical protein